jgi:hypothetical protein
MRIKLTTLVTFLSLLMMRTYGQETPSTDTVAAAIDNINQTLEVMKRIKFTGYIQAQYQVIDSAGAKSFAGGDFASGVDKRFLLRRGRLKAQYDAPINAKGWSTSQYVFQIDVSQSGLTIKDLYAKFTDPWCGWFSVTAGMQNRPFGFEVPYSSGLRESPERARMSQTIFPNERDLGAMVTIQGPKLSNWNWIKLEAGMFNGTGAPSAGANTTDFDKFKDFIGHLTITRANKSESIKWGLGASYYSGGFRQDNSNRYTLGTDSTGVKGYTVEVKKADVSTFINNRGKTERTYVGGDGQLSIDWRAGMTTIRAEYIQGTQSAVASSSVSPATQPVSQEFLSTSTSVTTIDSLGAAHTTTTTKTSATATNTPLDIYVRKFNGAYFYFIQNIGASPWQAIVKYDWYDPNTDVQGDEIGKNAFGNSGSTKPNTTNPTDLKYTTIGVGLAYRWDANVKITAYYDMVKNETSQNLTGGNAIYQHDLQDNVFTIRAQVKF